MAASVQGCCLPEMAAKPPAAAVAAAKRLSDIQREKMRARGLRLMRNEGDW